VKKLTVFGFAGGLAASAIASGVAVAYAHGNGSHHADIGMMNGTSMQMPMDAASVDDHMRQVMGDDAYQRLRNAVGESGFEAMLTAMESVCPSMGQVANAALPTGSHESHHPNGAP
jgi:Spy/CpxP family protein refolding chaperone